MVTRFLPLREYTEHRLHAEVLLTCLGRQVRYPETEKLVPARASANPDRSVKYSRRPLNGCMANLAIGTEVRLVFQTQFQTFTPDQFTKTLKERSYLESRSQIQNPANPQAPPTSIPSFSKEDISVLIPPAFPQANPTIFFRIINTINLKSIYNGEVNPMLNSLKIFPDLVSQANFRCTTRWPAKTKPLDRLTSLVNKTFIDRISKDFPAPLGIGSLRFTTDPQSEREGCQVIIEPLASNREKEYYLEISYRTTNKNEFDDFIDKFGNTMIQKIMEED